MPRKRRQPKRRLPQGLAEISPGERSRWRSFGPTMATDIVEGAVVHDRHLVWPDWRTWAEFYATFRDELYADRPWLRERSVADACYLAWREGRDPEAAREDALAARAAADPRLVLMKGRHAS